MIFAVYELKLLADLRQKLATQDIQVRLQADN